MQIAYTFEQRLYLKKYEMPRECLASKQVQNAMMFRNLLKIAILKVVGRKINVVAMLKNPLFGAYSCAVSASTT